MKKKLFFKLIIVAALLGSCGKDETTEAVENVGPEQQTEIAETAGPEQQTESVDESTEVQQETETEVVGDEEMPILEDFVEEAAGKNTFESYDEVISYLTSGQAYAYVDVYGSEEPLLLVTEATYDNMDGNQASIEADIFMKNDNGVQYASSISSEGTAYPLAVGEGLLYQGGNHDIGVMCVSEDTKAIMYMASIYEEFDESGNAHYGGFIRSENVVADDGEEIDTDSDEVFLQMMERYQKADVINFTVIE